jgi:hypothetical protein
MKLLTDHSLLSMAWSYDTNDINSRDCPSNGSWTSSNEVNLHIQPELIFTDLLLHPMLFIVEME